MFPCFRAVRLAQFREWRRWRDKVMTFYEASMKAKSEGQTDLYNYFGIAGKFLLGCQPPIPKRRKPRPKCMRPTRKEPTMRLALLLCLIAAPAFAAEPPKAANCPAKAKAAPVVIVVRHATLGERIIERRMARLSDQYARQQERASRGFVLRVFVGGRR